MYHHIENAGSPHERRTCIFDMGSGVMARPLENTRERVFTGGLRSKTLSARFDSCHSDRLLKEVDCWKTVDFFSFMW